MKLRISILTLLLALPLATIALAHEGHHHDAMGVITTIDASQLTLRLAKGRTDVYTLTEETSFLRSEEPAAREQVAVGERAVVVYEEEDGANVAIEVKLGPKKKR